MNFQGMDHAQIIYDVASLADFLWLNDQVLLTCSKDGKVIQQLVRDGEKPVEKAVSPVLVTQSTCMSCQHQALLGYMYHSTLFACCNKFYWLSNVMSFPVVSSWSLIQT